MKRGRKLGEFVNARDERGWMIPKEGTLRRRVYEAMRSGNPRRAICTALGISLDVYDAHRAYIVNWRVVQARRNAAANFVFALKLENRSDSA